MRYLSAISLVLSCSVLHMHVTAHCPVLVCLVFILFSLITEQQKHLSHSEGMRVAIKVNISDHSKICHILF